MRVPLASDRPGRMAYAKTKIDVLQKTIEMRAAFDPTLRELF